MEYITYYDPYEVLLLQCQAGEIDLKTFIRRIIEMNEPSVKAFYETLKKQIEEASAQKKGRETVLFGISV